MKVLVACECSQIVAAAFRAKGHEAYSCDIVPCYGGHPEWHIQDDVLKYVNGKLNPFDFFFVTSDGKFHEMPEQWDMIIAFPPCTYLTKAGNRHFSPKRCTPDQIANREKLRESAACFFLALANARCDRIVVENPIGYMNTHYRKPNQIVQPYWFGDNAEKATCLWLKGVPNLRPTDMLARPAPHHYRADGKAIRFVESVPGTGGHSERARKRSQTFPGVAAAMANQWGCLYN